MPGPDGVETLHRAKELPNAQGVPFLILTACLYGMTALFGGNGLWLAWPAAELLSLIATFLALFKYRDSYQYT